MLGKQILKDQEGVPMGVFITMQSWNDLIVQYPEIEDIDIDVPQWEKDFIDNRLKLNMLQNYLERLKPIERTISG
jgi:hypothetical protein